MVVRHVLANMLEFLLSSNKVHNPSLVTFPTLVENYA